MTGPAVAKAKRVANIINILEEAAGALDWGAAGRRLYLWEFICYLFICFVAQSVIIIFYVRLYSVHSHINTVLI